MIGERRICFLYSITSPQRQPPVVTATCPEIVSLRVMAVNGYSDGSCDVVVQPTVLTTRTAPAYARVRLYGDLDRLHAFRTDNHPDPLVYEPYETLHLIQDGLNL